MSLHEVFLQKPWGWMWLEKTPGFRCAEFLSWVAPMPRIASTDWHKILALGPRRAWALLWLHFDSNFDAQTPTLGGQQPWTTSSTQEQSWWTTRHFVVFFVRDPGRWSTTPSSQSKHQRPWKKWRTQRICLDVLWSHEMKLFYDMFMQFLRVLVGTFLMAWAFM